MSDIQYRPDQTPQNAASDLVYNVSQAVYHTRYISYEYHIFHRISNTLAPYITCLKHRIGAFFYLLICLKAARRMANSGDPDQTPHSAASDLGLQCLLRSV